MGLSEVAAAGDRVKTLQALRDSLAMAIDACASTPDKIAPLAARLADVLAQIDELAPAAKEADPVDEIAKRRSARGGATARPRRSTANQG